MIIKKIKQGNEARNNKNLGSNNVAVNIKDNNLEST